MSTEAASQPSHYHLLRRLVSLCYNSPARTSYFYVGLLYDLYNEDLLRGLTLPVVVSTARGSDDDTIQRESPGKGRLGMRLNRAASRSGSKGHRTRSKNSTSDQDSIEFVNVPRHLALHIKGWSFINNKEYYSAVTLVKGHIEMTAYASEKFFRWYSDTGTVDPILPSYLHDDESETEDELDLDPLDMQERLEKRKQKFKESLSEEVSPCLECAMIHAAGCESLGRIEEGRLVLERTVKTLEHCLEENDFHQAMATPPSPIPVHPTSPLLQLARMLSSSNAYKLANVKQQADEDKENEMSNNKHTPGKYLEEILKASNAVRGNGAWCWEAWEEFCQLGEKWTHSQSPFSEPQSHVPLDPFPPHLLPAPPSLTADLLNLLNSFSATTLESVAGSHYALSSLANGNGRMPSTNSAQSLSDMPSSPRTESSAASVSSPTKDNAEGGRTPRRKMSPLPHHSPLTKAAHAGYTLTPASVMPVSISTGPSGFFTPVANSAGASGSGMIAGAGLFHGVPLRGVKGKSVIRAPSPSGNISFPDLSFYGADAPRSDSQLFPGVKTPIDSHIGRNSKSSQLMPSIASQLFPHAKETSSFGFGETPVQAGVTYEPGIGKPPVAKRPRSRAVEVKNEEKGRNATGRNISGKMNAKENENTFAPVRRSARIQESVHSKPWTPKKPLQPRRTQGPSGPLPELPDSSSTNHFRHPPASPPTSTGIPSSPPPMKRDQHDRSTQARADIQAVQQHTADTWLLCLVRRCAAAYFELSRYECKKAMELLDTLPANVQAGSWSLCMFGRAFYEMADYEVARNAFAQLRRLEPYRLRDMEWFSTVLWHLDDRAELSQLAQDLMTIDRNAPQTWIATGNSFALQGEHDQAVRCFKRASLVDPGMAYTYTLTAYEALEMEEFDRAIAYYQSAIRTDVRHYHAWFGLGRVYQKTGRLRLAEYHFRRAMSINSSNVVLCCCVGTAMEKRGDLKGALDVFEKALLIDPKNKMARFRKARVLMGLKRYEEAYPMLHEIARTSSGEASVIFLLAKLCRIMGDLKGSTRLFTHARDLNPKLASVIQAWIGDDRERDEARHGEPRRR